MKIIASSIGFAIVLTGCSQTPSEPITLSHPNSVIANTITKSSDAIHTDLQQLIKLKQLNPHTYQPKKTPTEGPLARRITLKWVGSPEEAIKTMSALIGFPPPKVVGKKPANLSNILLNAVDRPAAEVLEDIGLQMGDRAGIAIGTDQITILYEGAHE